MKYQMKKKLRNFGKKSGDRRLNMIKMQNGSEEWREN